MSSMCEAMWAQEHKAQVFNFLEPVDNDRETLRSQRSNRVESMTV